MPEPEAAVAIVHARGAEESVLLMRRAERADDPWSGHWSFPGGRREPEDADLLDTAIRELAEECGIRLERAQMEEALAPTNAGRRLGRVILVAPFLFRVDREQPTVLDPREAAEALWIPLGRLRDPAEHGLRAVPRLPKEVAFPAIELNGTPLWGFTYRVITHWLGLHAQQPPAAPGFEAARLLLEFLLARGLTLQQGWTEDSVGRHLATVHGEIPATAVLEHFSTLRGEFPGVNRIEVQPDSVLVVGLALEEYLVKTDRSKSQKAKGKKQK
ncbi:MAG: CoA pyrophosphatase [Acidobacteriia bacterium]|nr:CoA pyrophosphatase [Terriglobia bacterium]MBZ5583577.1 CoA pyrophosphatase [Terriglobia bacterium]